MGFDIVSYFDVDQQEISEFVNDIPLEDRDSWKISKMIAEMFRAKHVVEPGLQIMHSFNQDCGFHEIMSFYGTNFIRDDDRFSNRRYHKILEEKVGKSFPHCLQSMNWYIRGREDALEVVRELRVFFADEDRLMHFADWLETTAKYCSIYELSY